MTTPSPKPSVIERLAGAEFKRHEFRGWRPEEVEAGRIRSKGRRESAASGHLRELAVIVREMPVELVGAVLERAELATGIFSIAGAINGVADWLDQQADHQ